MIFDDDNNKTVDIPDFVEEKADLNDPSLDMSIFKMSDEELYDDVPAKEEKVKTTKKKANSTIILCLAVIGILLITTIISLFYGINQNKAVKKVNDELTQVKATIADYQAQIADKDNQIAALQQEIEKLKEAGTATDPTNKYPSGTKLYITEDGSTQGVREKATIDSNTVEVNGNKYILYWGDAVTLTADATKDNDGNYWGKIDKGYIRIEYKGEIWATIEEQ